MGAIVSFAFVVALRLTKTIQHYQTQRRSMPFAYTLRFSLHNRTNVPSKRPNERQQ